MRVSGNWRLTPGLWDGVGKKTLKGCPSHCKKPHVLAQVEAAKAVMLARSAEMHGPKI